MARPRTNNKTCKVCGRPAAISYQADGTPYNRSVCHHCRSVMYKFGVGIDQLINGINPFKCEWCGWEGYCDVHHKDGNHDNDKKDNLEILCPNCHRNHHFPLPEIVE